MPLPSTNYHIWLIGAESHYVTRLCHRLSLNSDYILRRFLTVAQALAHRPAVPAAPSVLILDSDGPKGLPQRTVRKLRQRLPAAHCYVLAGAPSLEAEGELRALGISGYLAKDADGPERLWQVLALARQPPALAPTPPVAADAPAGQLLGQHASMQQVRELLAKAARTSITVSVSGEPGTGKELVARAIHAESARAQQPFVAVNVAAIPRELLESELFGHEKGAFAGAAARRAGRFEEASGGTLFLDEIADLELVLQAKLLRGLQARAVARVGGSLPVPFDVRLVVATHRDLAAEVRAGRFREDLFYRLLGLPIELPPLRHRGGDVLLLAEAFLHNFSQLNQLPVRAFSSDARQRLASYAFPGNVRELKALVELAAVLAEGEHVEAADIQPRPAPAEAAPTATAVAPALVSPSLREQTLAIMQASLQATGGDVVAAASHLRVGRSTLYRLVQSGQLYLPAA